jgi:hypothetical protein
MFHFAEYFVRKSIRNGVSLLIISAFLIYLSSGSLLHYVSIPVFLISAVCWIYFGFKFKKMLYSVDEPADYETETNKFRFFKSIHSLLSATLLVLMILSLGFPNGKFLYFLVAVISLLFITSIYQIIIISNYLKKEVRN